MAAKKKVKKKSRVSPPITDNNNYVDYANLENGDCFLYLGNLWMKFDVEDQEAVNLDTGDNDCLLCDKMVIPVDITINWKRK